MISLKSHEFMWFGDSFICTYIDAQRKSICRQMAGLFGVWQNVLAQTILPQRNTLEFGLDLINVIIQVNEISMSSQRIVQHCLCGKACGKMDCRKDRHRYATIAYHCRHIIVAPVFPGIPLIANHVSYVPNNDMSQEISYAMKLYRLFISSYDIIYKYLYIYIHAYNI